MRCPCLNSWFDHPSNIWWKAQATKPLTMQSSSPLPPLPSQVQILSLALILLSLASQPSLGLGLLHKTWLNFLEASQQLSFLQGRVVSPTPNPQPRGPGLCIYISQRQGGYPF
jgi:hypothetical protein